MTSCKHDRIVNMLASPAAKMIYQLVVVLSSFLIGMNWSNLPATNWGAHSHCGVADRLDLKTLKDVLQEALRGLKHIHQTLEVGRVFHEFTVISAFAGKIHSVFGAQRWHLTEVKMETSVAKLKLLFARRSEALDSNWFGNWHARTWSCCSVENVEIDIGIWRFTPSKAKPQTAKQFLCQHLKIPSNNCCQAVSRRGWCGCQPRWRWTQPTPLRHL